MAAKVTQKQFAAAVTALVAKKPLQMQHFYQADERLPLCSGMHVRRRLATLFTKHVLFDLHATGPRPRFLHQYSYVVAATAFAPLPAGAYNLANRTDRQVAADHLTDLGGRAWLANLLRAAR